MKVGFTGTRRGMTEAQSFAFRKLIPPMESFHHGSCQGADVEAARIVASAFVYPPRIVCHPGPTDDPCRTSSGVDDEAHPSKTHFARNRDIVNATDRLIACPADMTEQPRGGTYYTINYARKVGKPITIIWPDGTVTGENSNA